MSYEVVTRIVNAQPLAAVRRRVLIGDVGRTWKSALDLVWRAATGRAFGTYSWEIYGDWTDDETKLETQVIYLLS